MKPGSRTSLGKPAAAKPRRAPARVPETEEAHSDLRTLLESMPQGVCVHRDFRPLFVNAAFARLHGFASAAEVLALDSVLDLMPAERHTLSRERAAERLAGRDAPMHFQEVQRRKDGTEFLAEKTLRVVSWGGQPAIATFLSETTPSGRMAFALGASEQRFRDFADVASDWLWETDSEHRFTYFSDRFTEVVGIPDESRIGRRRTEFGTGLVDPAEWERHLQDLAARRPFRNLHYTYQDMHGGTRHAQVSGKPYLDANGRFLGYRGSGTDITGETEALGRAERAHQRLIDAMENIPAAFIVYDAEERIELANERILQIYPDNPLLRTPGAKYEEMMRWSVEHGELLSGGEDPEAWIRQRLEKFRHPGDPFEFQLADGRWINALDRKTADGGTVCIRIDISDQKRREEALRASQEALDGHRALLQAVLDALPLWVFVKDRESRFIMVNRNMSAEYGVTPDEYVMITRGPCDWVQPEERAFFRSIDCQVMETGEQVDVQEETVSLPDGKVSLRHTIKAPLRDAHGEITGVVAVSEAIDERKRAERELRASEERFRNLIEGSIQGILVHRANRPLFVNPAYARMFGYDSPEALLAMPSLDALIAPDDRRRLAEYYRARQRGEPAPSRYSFQGIRKDGSPIWVETLARAIDWESGPAVLGTYFDITERREAEQRLRASEVRFRNLVEGSIQGIVVHRQHAPLFINEAFAHIFGYESAAELLAQPSLGIIVAPEDRERLFAYQRARLEGGTAPDYYQFEGQRKDGSRVWLDAISRVVEWEDGPAVQSTMYDITQRKLLEEQLLQSQKMEAVGKLAGGIAHDFNNLLQVISGFTRLALADVPAEEALHEDLQMIHQATERAAGLTRQLLAFSRRQVLNPTDLSLNDLVTNMVRLLERLIEKHISVTVIPGEELPAVRGDAGMIEQVLMNLCLNARDAMTSGGHLIIETQDVVFDAEYCHRHPWARPGRFAMIAVTDTGTGIPAEVREHIFEPFFTTKEIGQGTGLGLSTVYGIVQQHDGLLTVDSILGTGSTFRVYLPAGGAVGTSAAPEPGVAPRGGGESILVVEDDPNVRAVASRTLARHGYRVTAVEGGAEALEALRAGPQAIDLVLLDLIMPNMTGEEAFRRLRQVAPGMRFVLATGYSESVPRMEGDAPPLLLQKPYSPELLLATVNAALKAGPSPPPAPPERR